jgi:hypothetical protein
MTDNAKFDDVQRGIRLLFKPGQLVELRAKTASMGWRGFYFTDHDRMAEVVAKLDGDSRIVSLYYVINACKPNLIKKRQICDCEACKGGGLVVDNPTDSQIEQILHSPKQHLTSNDDVETLNWLFIDVDTTSTEERPFRQNRIIPPKAYIGEVTLDQILAVGNDGPRDRKQSSDIMPDLDPSFDPEEWIDWYESQGAFKIEKEREARGVTYKITDICLNAGHKHTGSVVTGFAVGDTFGYHCFSDDCEGVTIGMIVKKLMELGYKPYPYPIWAQQTSTLDFAEDDELHVHSRCLPADGHRTASMEPQRQPTAIGDHGPVESSR